jgi:hypothetical protein
MIIGALLVIVWDPLVRENFELLCMHFNEKGGPTSRLSNGGGFSDE